MATVDTATCTGVTKCFIQATKQEECKKIRILYFNQSEKGKDGKCIFIYICVTTT